MFLIGGEFPPNDDSEAQVHCLVFLLSSTMVAKVAVFICKKWWKEKEGREGTPFLNCSSTSYQSPLARTSHMASPGGDAGKCSPGSCFLWKTYPGSGSGSRNVEWTVSLSATHLSVRRQLCCRGRGSSRAGV